MSNVLDWLLEEDANNPGVRWFALTGLLGLLEDDARALEARRYLMSVGPMPAILAAQHAEGYWEQPGHGYSPKYRGTVWSIIYLAQLGADSADPRVQAGANYVLAHAIASSGMFSATGTPMGGIMCLAGNLGAALLDLGLGEDSRLHETLERTAQFATGDGIAPAEDTNAALRYLRSGTCAPGYCCAASYQLPCAWGAIKVLSALNRVPERDQTPTMRAAAQIAVDFLLSVDPATAAYPHPGDAKPSQSWFRFGFPLFYISDVLQTAEVLTGAGLCGDPRLSNLYDLILAKREPEGYWKIEYSAYQGKTWYDPETRGKPSKWVTLRAMRVLQAAGIAM